MSTGLAVALIAAGVVLVIWGVSASDSFTSDISRLFSGVLTDRATWLWIGGVAAVLVGMSGLLRGRRWN